MAPISSAASTTRTKDWSALATVMTLAIGFTYSDDTVEFADDLAGGRFEAAEGWLVFALDGLLVLATAVLRWRLIRPADLRVFVKSLLTGRWGAGAALVVLAHLALICTAGWRTNLGVGASVAVSVAASAVFVVAMALLLLSALSDAEGRTTRGWVAPIVLGTLGAQLASALWYPAIEREENCAGEISAWYFSNMGHMFALLLLTLCMELNYLRRNPTALDAGQRVAPLFTVIMLGVSLPLSFTVLVKADMPRCGIAAVWHEYFTFVFTAQALIIGLATVVWLLIRGATDADADADADGQGKR